jgi:glutathione reductase (NADPH)
VAFVGGGYIAFEFAHIAARAGAEITILHRGERPLEAFDADLVGQLVEITRELGVTVHLGTEVTAIDKTERGLVVHARSGEQDRQLEADIAVHAAGRVPEVDDLGLDAAGIKRSDDGAIAVNEYLQSVNNPAVYAAGDAVAEEIINIFALAIRHQLPASDLSHMLYAYPTSASDISSML